MLSNSDVRERPNPSGAASEIHHALAEPAATCGAYDEPYGVIDAAPVMIWMAGADHLPNYFNRAWLAYRGRAMKEEIGTGWLDGLHPEDRTRRLTVFEHSSDRRLGFQDEYRLQRYDGTHHWILENAVPYSVKNRFCGYIGSCIDIHGQKTVEESLRETEHTLRVYNEELEAFTSAATHDLQEPLRTVAIYTQLLAKTDRNAGPGTDQYFRFVFAGIERMQALVRGLLHHALISQASSYAFTDVDCNAAFDEAASACRAAADQSGAIITRSELPHICADTPQIVQVFQNLLSNAIKYRRQDLAPLIHTSATTEPNRWVFQVADNGIGFDNRYADRIFRSFERLHGGAAYSGAGLGLAICKKVVERHGGRIWAKSELGHGSQFFFTIPRPQ